MTVVDVYHCENRKKKEERYISNDEPVIEIPFPFVFIRWKLK
jgi:hypothetical protein